MRILILGGAGAIGAAIARHADALGHDTHVGLRRGTSPLRLASHPRVRRHAVDVGDADAMRQLLHDVQPDALVMAAIPSGHALTTDARRELLLGMGAGLLGVLESAHAVGFKGTLTWLGSSMAYGRGGAPRQPQAALQPQTFRGAVKAAESLLAAQLATQFGLALTELRVFCAYGPFEQRDRFFPRLLRAALTHERVSLPHVPGRRDWTHYEDIAGACLASATPWPGNGPRVFNACGGQLQDTHAAAALLEGITGRRLVADAPYEVADRYGDVEPGVLPSPTEGLGWAPRIDLAHGLQQCWQWAQSAEGRAWLLGPTLEAQSAPTHRLQDVPA